MSNVTANQLKNTIGPAGTQFDLPIKASTHIYEGILCSQLTSGGMLVPYSTASSGVCVGVSQFEADNTAGSDGDLRMVVESRRMYAFLNDGTHTFAESSLIGAVAYGTNDVTVSTSSADGKPVGFFYGMESDGKVRVFIDPPLASIVAALQGLTDSPATADALRDNIVAAFG